MRSLPRGAFAYVCVVIGAGAAVMAVAIGRANLPWVELGFLAALYWTGDCGRITTKLRTLSISATFPISLAAILLVGPRAAIVACVLAALLAPSHTVWFKRLFNTAQVALSVLSAGLVYQVTPGSSAGGFLDARFPSVLVAVAATGFTYCVVNYLLVGLVVSLTTQMSLAVVWWRGMSETAVSNLGYGLLGLVTAVLWSGGVGPIAPLLVLAPIFIARWAFQQYGEQHKAYEATVASLIRAVETKDYYTRGHSERVARASVMIAEQLGMREARLEMLRYAGMLHDVGKLGVPTKLLQKTGPLDEQEFGAIKLHPTRGFEMINGISFLDEAVLGVKHHHERVDGLGYPDGLSGNEIPEFARVIAVADAFDSMTSTRSYRSARTVDAAVGELRRWAGTQFDVEMVEALIAAVEIHGWQPNVDVTEEIIDPADLVFVDHDDPAQDLASLIGYQASLRSEVS